MPFVHLERDLWDLRDAAAPAPAPRPFPRPTQLRQTFPRRRRLPQSAGLAQSADRRYSAMGVLGSAIGLITPIAPTLSAAASAISASSQSAGAALTAGGSACGCLVRGPPGGLGGRLVACVLADRYRRGPRRGVSVRREGKQLPSGLLLAARVRP